MGLKTLPDSKPDPIRSTDDSARNLARTLLDEVHTAALATHDTQSGFPCASLVSMALDDETTPVILVSHLSAHTKNLIADPRASLLLAKTGKGDPLAHPRITLFATARRIERDSHEGQRVRARFLKRHPKAELYIDFPDFEFFAFDILKAGLNGGFGRAYELSRDDLIRIPNDAG